MKLFILLSALLLSTNVYAGVQEGAIKGTVKDRENQQRLVGVNVMLKENETGVSTDDQGFFKFENLEAGIYTVRFSFMGYRTYYETDVVVRSNRSQNIEIELQPQAVETDELTITGGYFNRDDANPVSRSTMNAEEIRRSPGSGQELSRVLHSMPGVASGGEVSQDVMVRGGSPSENGYYIDQIPIPSVQHFEMQDGSSNGPIGVVDTDLIRDIEFHTGGFSAAYGGHMSSVTNISYRQPSSDGIHGSANLNMAGFGGKFESPFADESGSIIISGRRSYLDLIAEAINTRGAPRYGDFQVKSTWEPDEDNRLTFLNIYGDSEIASTQEEGRDDGWHTYLESRNLQNTTGLNWRRIHSDYFYSNTSVSYSLVQDNTSMFFVESGDTETDFDVDRRFAHLRNHNYWNMNAGHRLEFGMDARYKSGDYDLFVAEDIMPTGYVREETKRDISLEGYHAGAYGNFLIRPFDRLDLSVGLRGTYYSLSEQIELEPRSTLSFNFLPRLTFNASAGMYHQHVPYYYLAQDESFEDLPPMQTRHLVAGLEYMLAEETRLTFEVYDKQYRDIPIQPEDASTPNLQYVPDGTGWYDELIPEGEAYARGIDFMLQRKLAKGFYGQVTASFFRSKYRDLNGDWRSRDYDIEYLFNVIGGYRLNDNWEFSARWTYMGDQPYTPIDEQASAANGRTILENTWFNEQRMPAHHSLFLRFDRRFFLSNLTMVTFFELWNAYNRENTRRYYWDNNQNEIGREMQFNTLPVGGIEIQF